MKVIQKKVCLLGDFGVGKTSLAARFVKNEFSEKYLTTVGVKMDTKSVLVSPEREIKFILWDIAGDSALNSKMTSYIRGSAGFIYVIDGTRANTAESFFQIKAEVDKLLGEIPFVLLMNKSDLMPQWDIAETVMTEIKKCGGPFFYTSAKTGDNVEHAFTVLAQQWLE